MTSRSPKEIRDEIFKLMDENHALRRKSRFWMSRKDKQKILKNQSWIDALIWASWISVGTK